MNALLGIMQNNTSAVSSITNTTFSKFHLLVINAVIAEVFII